MVNYNGFLTEIATSRNTITTAEEKVNAKIIKLRNDLEEKIGAEKEHLAELEKNVSELALMNIDTDFKDKKTLEFPAGKISIKKSGSGNLLVIDEKVTIAKLKELNLNHAIKVEESIKKAIVKDMPNLEELGCELIPAENKVYIETYKMNLTSTGLS